MLAEWLRRHWNSALQKNLPYFDTKKSKASTPPKFAVDSLSKAILGKNPNSDILRAFHVGDANFEAADLRLADIRWLNIVKWSGKEQAKWRDMASRNSKEKWGEASGLHAEVLLPGSLAPVTLQWDRFLLSDTRRWDAPLHAEDLLPKDFRALASILNGHARHLLNREIEFFDTFGQHKPKHQCTDLLKRIEQDREAAYLRLAWGSGWRGMTGDWQDDETAGTMRELYRLGRIGAGQFPKTRRLAVQGEPCLPLGWVRLVPWREDLRRRATSETASTPTFGHPWVEEQLALIQKQHRCRPEEALRGQPLAKAWQTLEDEDIKKAALDDIRSRWQKEGWWDNPPGKAARKALAIYSAE